MLVVMVVLASVGACVPCTGVLAAIGIPAVIGYVRRSKTIEAEQNVRRIAETVADAYSEDRSLPAAAPRTPARVGPDRQLWPPDADAAWAQLGFSPSDPLYYAYEYAPDPDGLGFAVRAHGDLDGDGIESTFEIRGTVDPTTRDVALAALEVSNELE